MVLMNAFSANMLAEFPASVRFEEVSAEDVSLTLACIEAGGDSWESAVGHADTAAVFGDVLGHDVPCVRSTVTLRAGDRAIVGQYFGPRLPEGCKTLPDGAAIKWLVATVEKSK